MTTHENSLLQRVTRLEKLLSRKYEDDSADVDQQSEVSATDQDALSAAWSTGEVRAIYTVWKYLIKSFTNEGMTVLDNCMGSGSTGVACVNTNRNFIGIELDDNYFKIADNRLREAMELKNESNSAVI